MKHTRRIASLLLALVMVFAMAISASAEGDPATPANGTITITPPEGVAANAENTYKIYKVFDAVTGENGSISYKVMASKAAVALPTGFVLDAAGNVHYRTITDGVVTKVDALTPESIAAIAAYVEKDSPVATVKATGAESVVASGLGSGYYYITTTVGTVVTIDSTNPYAQVQDKNTVPSVDKKITGASSVDADGKKALAQIGTTVDFSADITVGTGAKNYVFHDTMTSGLNYNNDVKVYIGSTEVTSGYSTGKTGNDTFTVTFTNDYIKTLEVGTKLTVKYSAVITESALTNDPENNTCYVSYGDENSNNRTPDSDVNVWNAKFTVTKHDGAGQALSGAGFVLKNATGAYYKYTPASAEGVTPATAATVTWYTLAEGETLAQAITEGKVTEYTSNAQGAVGPFIGLANGTYTLEESTVPNGYNKAADQNFTIAEHDYTAENLEQAATVVNQSGSELPSTGGMGTTLFYVVGGLMVLAAVVLLVTKKRMASAE